MSEDSIVFQRLFVSLSHAFLPNSWQEIHIHTTMFSAKRHFNVILSSTKSRDFPYFCDSVTKFGYAVTQVLVASSQYVKLIFHVWNLIKFNKNHKIICDTLLVLILCGTRSIQNSFVQRAIETQKSPSKQLSLKLVLITRSILQRGLVTLRAPLLAYDTSTVCPQANVAAEDRRALWQILEGAKEAVSSLTWCHGVVKSFNCRGNMAL